MRIRTKAVLRAAWIIWAALILLHVAAEYHMRVQHGYSQWLEIFDISGEQGLASLFSLFLWIAMVVLAAGQSRTAPHTPDRPWWAACAVAFIAAGLDDALSFHEQLTPVLREWIHPGYWFYYTWVIPYGAAVIVGLVFIYRFVARQQPRVRFDLWLGAALFVLGALGVEIPEGAYAATAGLTPTYYLGFLTVEESLELAGQIVVVGALLRQTKLAALEFRIALVD